MTDNTTTRNDAPGWLWDSPTSAPTPELFDVATAVIDVVAWLDRHDDRPPIERKTLRVLKTAEEIGEAVAAWIGVTGQNPRKGITATRQDVARELADVAFSALTAMHSLDDVWHPADALEEAYDAWRFINGTETTTALPDADVTEWLLRAIEAAGIAVSAFRLPNPEYIADATYYLARLVECACLGIAALGIDPNTQLAATARALVARTDAPAA